MPITRREFVQTAAAASVLAALPPAIGLDAATPGAPLTEFGYDQVRITGERQSAQRDNVTSILLGFNEDSLMKPFRAMGGQPAPGTSLGGWYEWRPDYNHHHDDAGLAPGSTFGQWTSAMARFGAASRFAGAPGEAILAERAQRLHQLLAATITTQYFQKTRFAGYSFDKLNCGLLDAHRLLHDPTAFATLDKVRAAATPALPGYAVDREVQWKPGRDLSWMWDETYTLPENLYLLSSAGAGPEYSQLARAYLLNATYFDPLAQNQNVLGDKHAYSYINSLCSAMQAYLTGGSEPHLYAAIHGFAYLERQSFVTGGWGPDELLRAPGYDQVALSLTASHNGFETPCGSYAHMKLTRYLLRATRNGHYGDSMERVLHNTVMGALPLQPDGRSFYSADYNVVGRRLYSVHRWPCCSGTLPQVVADYGINSYLRSPGAVWVNLYQPSELQWNEGGATIHLLQSGTYPGDGLIRMAVTASQPKSFTLHLRIPLWAAGGVTLHVNSEAMPVHAQDGFATVQRTWRSGDVLELHLPMDLRIEALPPDGDHFHLDTVALLRGPLVLFALRGPSDTGPLTCKEADLLNAQRLGPREWQVNTSRGPRSMVPFPDIGEREYSTYLKLA